MLQCSVSNYEMQSKERDERNELVNFLMGDMAQSTMGKALQ